MYEHILKPRQATEYDRLCCQFYFQLYVCSTAVRHVMFFTVALVPSMDYILLIKRWIVFFYILFYLFFYFGCLSSRGKFPSPLRHNTIVINSAANRVDHSTKKWLDSTLIRSGCVHSINRKIKLKMSDLKIRLVQLYRL